MSSKEINLTIGERVAAIGLLNAGTYNSSTLAFVFDDIKKLAMTDEDWTEAGLTKAPTDEALAAMSDEERRGVNQTWRWNEKNKDIELGGETIKALVDGINKKSDAQELTIQDGALVTLLKKLEVKE